MEEPILNEPTEKAEKAGKVFRIGIAMAGAVSAGAYTAGVIDYLLETLQSWEVAKQANRDAEAEGRLQDIDPSVPMHDVILEVMGGASAGGMTAAITTLSLYNSIEPVYEANEAAMNNPLYRAWVNLNDRPGEPDTFLQMLGKSDIKNGKVASLLNSRAIDEIANHALSLPAIRTPQTADWPPYISKELELILTICSLRGIPIEINFGTSGIDDIVDKVPAHSMYMHKGVGHFTIDVDKGERYDHLLGVPLAVEEDKPYDELMVMNARDLVVQTAKASGAFPGGLQPRVLYDVPREYLIAQIKRTFGNDKININWNRIPKNFTFTAVDGGTINNEPFDDVLVVLEERYKQDVEEGIVDGEKDAKNFALIMIDPFPSLQDRTDEKTDEAEEQNYEAVETLSGVAVGVFSAVRRQAMLKAKELSRGFAGDYTRSIIFPVRRTHDADKGYQKEEHAIACGALSGFGGFFAREFREHDFALGRKNCQSFLRKHFSLAEGRPVDYETMEDEAAMQNTIFKDIGWGHPIYDRYHYVKDGVAHLPIIPDMRVKKASSDDPAMNGTLAGLPYPQISVKQLKKYRRPMRKRLHAIVVASLKGAFKKGNEPTPEEKAKQKQVNKMVSKHLASSWLIRLLRSLLIILAIPIVIVTLPVLLLAYTFGLSYVVRSVFRHIVADFKARGLIEE